MEHNSTPHHVRTVKLEGATLRLSFWKKPNDAGYHSVISIQGQGWDFQSNADADLLHLIARTINAQSNDLEAME